MTQANQLAYTLHVCTRAVIIDNFVRTETTKEVST